MLRDIARKTVGEREIDIDSEIEAIERKRQ